MTNYEWLLQMGGEERQAWFDADHVDANDVSTRKGDVRADDVCANDANVAHDSREKLEADMRRILEGVCEHVCRYHNVPALLVYGPNEYGDEEQLEELLNDAVKLLDRQAAITEREAFMRGRASLDNEFAEYTDEIAELTAQLYELTAELDALADDLLTCNKEREEYRRKLSDVLGLIYEAYHVGNGAYD